MKQRSASSIDVKLFYLYASSIVEHEFLDMEKCDSCYCSKISLKDYGDPWIYIDIEGEGTLEIENQRYAVYGNKEVSDGKWIKATTSGKIRLCPSFVGLLGEKNISINGLYLIYFEPSTFRYLIKAKLVNEASKYISGIFNELNNILNKSLDLILISTISGKNLQIALKTQLVKAPWYLDSLSNYADINSIEGKEIDYKKLRENSERAESLLERELEKLRNKVGPLGIVDLVSHAHIDFAWLWDTNVTKQKVYRNITNVLSLIKNNDFLRYAISNVVYLKWIKDYYPGIYNEVKEFIKEGKIIPVGGMWVESDTNLLGGESLVRQLLYGQRFLLEEFGKTTSVGWLPDSFGFSGQLPQIFKKSGINGFYTHKLYWNTINKFPYSVFIWKGIDGTEIPSINYPTYGSDLSPNQLISAWNDHKVKEIPSFLVFGHGDGGGGPTWLMLERYKIYKDFPGLPRLLVVSPEFHMNEIENNKELLPVWIGELYLETHRGVYTNGVKLKELMREVENLLIEIEVWSVLFNKKVDLKDYWLKLLEFQFHDSISATTTKDVYNSTVKQLENMRSQINYILYRIFNSVVKNGNSITFFNYLPWSREEIVELKNEIKDMNCQKIDENYIYRIALPPSGYKSFEIGKCKKIEESEINSEKVIENEKIKIEIGDDNKIKVYDKNKGLIINDMYLISCEDMPERFDGWDIDESYKNVCDKINLNHKFTLKGSIKNCLFFENNYSKSKIDTKICIYNDVIEINHDINWLENLRLLKFIIETNLSGQYNHAEIPYGVIERPTQPSNSWDEAKFESPMWKWVELWDPDYGIALINYGRQGYNAYSNAVGLTLLRSPLFPNPDLDRGHLDITYWIYPHLNSWRESLTPKIAMELNNKIKYAAGFIEEKSHFDIDPQKILFGSLKYSEDGESIILRLWEPYGKNSCIMLNIDGFSIIGETDILENKLISKGEYNKICFKPYEIKTIKLKKKL
ncbi:MAG: alpha-mannosidase [Caldisphaera sp.]